MTDRLLSSLASTLRLASLAACLVVITSFVLFAVDESSTAAHHQVAQLQTPQAAAATTPAPHGPSAARRAIDRVASDVELPFHAFFSGTSSEWALHGGELVCALIVYGLGVGYVLRFVRVHA